MTHQSNKLPHTRTIETWPRDSLENGVGNRLIQSYKPPTKTNLRAYQYSPSQYDLDMAKVYGWEP